MAGFAFALGLLALLAAVGFAFYWQGSIRLPGAPVAYGVEDSIKYITPRLAAETQTAIGSRSVRRILEWEMKFLQDQLDADPAQIVVLGGDAATEYVLEQTARQGFDYSPDVVAEVLELQAEYMQAIGALAGAVDAAEREALGLNDDG